MKTWKVGGQTVEVKEDGDESFGICSIADCQEEAAWRSGAQGRRCAEHAKVSG